MKAYHDSNGFPNWLSFRFICNKTEKKYKFIVADVNKIIREWSYVYIPQIIAFSFTNLLSFYFRHEVHSGLTTKQLR